jgi:hypothetical protein
MITNWHDLNAVLTVASEDRVGQLLKEEMEQHKRVTYLVRLHQRYTMLRAQRERREMLEMIEK